MSRCNGTLTIYWSSDSCKDRLQKAYIFRSFACSIQTGQEPDFVLLSYATLFWFSANSLSLMMREHVSFHAAPWAAAAAAAGCLSNEIQVIG